MPSDFGDESGEKLFDWMLRLGQEAGQAAMTHSAARVSKAPGVCSSHLSTVFVIACR